MRDLRILAIRDLSIPFSVICFVYNGLIIMDMDIRDMDPWYLYHQQILVDRWTRSAGLPGSVCQADTHIRDLRRPIQSRNAH